MDAHVMMHAKGWRHFVMEENVNFRPQKSCASCLGQID